MRVLVYIEPFPLRDSMIHFRDVARDFLSVLGNHGGCDVRMYANDETFDFLISDAADARNRYLIRPSYSEAKMFQRHLMDWHAGGIELWMQLMNGQGVADDYVEVLRRIWRVFPFDVIVHWGENGAITRFVKEKNISRVAMELGCTRTPFVSSVVMDPYGTNGAAIVPQLDIKDIEKIVDRKPLPAIHAALAHARDVEAFSAYEDQFAFSSTGLSPVFLSQQKVAFLPLQLYDDANLLRFSPYETVADVVMDVVPKLVEHGFYVVVKPHPASKYRGRAHLENEMARNALAPWMKSIFWCGYDSCSNSQLMRLADVVITVNSSTGFEALYFDKPVVVLGDAVYKPKGLFPTLDQFLTDSYDKEAYLYNIGLLRRFFLCGYLRDDAVRSDATRFLTALAAVDGASRQGADPFEVAKGLYRVSNAQHMGLINNRFLHAISLGSADAAESLVPTASVLQVSQSDQMPAQAKYFARRLLKISSSGTQEDFKRYLDVQLDDIQGRLDFCKSASLVDEEYYYDKYPDVKNAEESAFVHYVHFGFDEGRSPNPLVAEGNFKSTILDLVANVLKEKEEPTPLSAHALESRNRALLGISDKLKASPAKICVVAHLYYSDLVDELLDKLGNITESFDLVITLPDWGADVIEDKVSGKFPNAVFYKSVNRGRDIGPFLDILSVILESEYDLVLKLQTKRGYYQAGKLLPELGDAWRLDTLDLMLRDEELVSRSVAHLRDNPNTLMLGPAPYYVSLERYPYHDQGYFAEGLMGNAAWKKNAGFFAGTMFWVKPECLRPLIEKFDLSILSFGEEAGLNDGELAHLVERAMGHLASSVDGVSTVDALGNFTESAKPSEQTLHEYLVEKEDEIFRKSVEKSLA